MVQNFSPFQGRKFSRFTAWTSEVDDIIAYVNGEIQVILGVFLLEKGILQFGHIAAGNDTGGLRLLFVLIVLNQLPDKLEWNLAVG